nr:hypothetical protein [Tanacetum cinerariifolium]
MATTIDQQVALDESLVPSTQRLRIGRSNFRLPSDIQSKESTLQVVYDVLRNSPLFRAFQVTADVPEIYIEMLHISPRIPNQSFADLPTEEEILDFLRFLGHSHEIRYLTDVNVNKLYQPWRSFASVINKCLTGKSSGVDRVPDVPSDDSEEEISWNSSDDEDVGGHEEGDKSDESDDERDEGSDGDSDKTVKAGAGKDDDDNDDEDYDDNDEGEELAKSDEEDTETGKGGDEVRESEGESNEEETRQEVEESFDLIPKTPEESEDESNDEEDLELRLSEEARIQEEEDADELYRDVNINQGRGLQVTQNVEDSHVTLTPVNPDGPQESFRFEERLRSLETSFFEYRQTNPFVDAVSAIPGIVHRESEGESDEEETRQKEEESFDPIPKTPEESEEESNDEEDQDLRLSEEARIQEEEDTKRTVSEFICVVVRDKHVKPDQRCRVESIFTTASSPIISLQTPTPIMTPSTIATITTSSEPPIPPPTIPSIILENLPTFNSTFRFDERLRSLETSFSEYRQTNLFFDAVSAIPEEVYKATTNQLDLVNPEGQQYPHNLLQPLPLIPDNRGRRVIPFDHFINNDLEYVRGGASSRKYTTSVTKTKAADYGHIKWIEDLFYGYAVNRESALDVYSKRRIITVTELKIVEWHDYKYLDWILVR